MELYLAFAPKAYRVSGFSQWCLCIFSLPPCFDGVQVLSMALSAFHNTLYKSRLGTGILCFIEKWLSLEEGSGNKVRCKVRDVTGARWSHRPGRQRTGHRLEGVGQPCVSSESLCTLYDKTRQNKNWLSVGSVLGKCQHITKTGQEQVGTTPPLWAGLKTLA